MEIILPYGLVDRHTGESLVRLKSDVLWSEARRFWKGVLAGPATITTPDGFVNEYAAAVVGQMAEQVGYRQKMGYWMLKTSPNHYENYWPCNGAKALPTFDMRGLTRYSRPVLKSFVDTQTDDVSGLTIERTHGKKGEVKGEGYARRPGFLGNFRGWSANSLSLVTGWNCGHWPRTTGSHATANGWGMAPVRRSRRCWTPWIGFRPSAAGPCGKKKGKRFPIGACCPPRRQTTGFRGTRLEMTPPVFSG